MNYWEGHVILDMKEETHAVKEMAKFYDFKTSLSVRTEESNSVKRLYCTSHDRDYINLSARMGKLINTLQIMELPVKRKRIELIVLDEKL